MAQPACLSETNLWIFYFSRFRRKFIFCRTCTVKYLIRKGYFLYCSFILPLVSMNQISIMSWINYLTRRIRGQKRSPNCISIVFPLSGVQLDPPCFIVHENQPKRDKFVWISAWKGNLSLSTRICRGRSHCHRNIWIRH